MSNLRSVGQNRPIDGSSLAPRTKTKYKKREEKLSTFFSLTQVVCLFLSNNTAKENNFLVFVFVCLGLYSSFCLAIWLQVREKGQNGRGNVEAEGVSAPGRAGGERRHKAAFSLGSLALRPSDASNTGKLCKRNANASTMWPRIPA